MTNHLAMPVLMVCAMFLAATVHAQNEWLVGAWELVPEEGSNAKDRIEFDAKGQAFSINPTIGSKTPGTYELSGSQVNITYEWNGRKLELEYSYDSAKNVLYFDSGDPNHPALYRKVK